MGGKALGHTTIWITGRYLNAIQKGVKGGFKKLEAKRATTELEGGSFDAVSEMTSDRYGKPVDVGTKVRIVELAPF